MNLPSLCEGCQQLRIVHSGKGSRFVMCQIGIVNREWEKYPMQPVLHCRLFLKKTMNDGVTIEDEAARQGETKPFHEGGQGDRALWIDDRSEVRDIGRIQ